MTALNIAIITLYMCTNGWHPCLVCKRYLVWISLDYQIPQWRIYTFFLTSPGNFRVVI